MQAPLCPPRNNNKKNTHLWSAGRETHSLVCMVTPPPQDLEQGVHGLQEDQTPSIFVARFFDTWSRNLSCNCKKKIFNV